MIPPDFNHDEAGTGFPEFRPGRTPFQSSSGSAGGRLSFRK